MLLYTTTIKSSTSYTRAQWKKSTRPWPSTEAQGCTAILLEELHQQLLISCFNLSTSLTLTLFILIACLPTPPTITPNMPVKLTDQTINDNFLLHHYYNFWQHNSISHIITLTALHIRTQISIHRIVYCAGSSFESMKC